MAEKELNTADHIKETAAEIEETTERVLELAQQNVELTRRAHALVHETPDLSPLAGGAASDGAPAEDDTNASSPDDERTPPVERTGVPDGGEKESDEAAEGSSAGEEPDEEIPGHS